MSSRERLTGGQVAILIGGVAVIAVMAWLLIHLLDPAIAASPTPTVPTRTFTLTVTPSPSPSVTPTPTATATPTATFTPTPLVPLTCLPLEGPSEEARVVAVVNGAYIEVKTDRERFFVRYLGVDPTGDGQAAAALNRSLVEGQVVSLLMGSEDQDEQGNRLRYVVAGDRFVNFELVRQGTALVGLYPPPRACLDTLLAGETLARDEQLGYWGLAEITPLATAPVDLSPAPCDCRVIYFCSDFSSQSEAQACYNACGDYRNANLDRDHNGLACDE